MRSFPAALLSLVTLVACGGAPPPPPTEEATRPAAPPEEPKSAEWEIAAKGASDDKAAQCAAVGDALKAERACVGSLCAHGASLAKEWARRCVTGAASGLEAAIAGDLADRAKLKPSECAARAEAILEDGCGRDVTCEASVQRWAALCAKSDASPLVLGLLARAVAKRAVVSKFEIDLRGCDEIRAEMRRGVACDRASCPAALKTAQAYRARCVGPGELLEAPVALAEIAILAAAGQGTAPTLVRPNPPKLGPADMPVLLPDRRGAVASVCDMRSADMAAYVANRRACRDGKIVLVRTYVNVSKDFEVRAGALDAPGDETFARRYPSLRAVGEIEARDAAAKQALEAELPKVAALAKDPANAAEAARALVRLAREHGAALARSASVREAFAAADGDLAPAVAAIGKAKLAAAKATKSSADLAGLAARAPTRPFADLGEDGAVSIGAPSAASPLEGASLFPKAMAAYSAALGDLAAVARRKPLSPKDARETATRATEAAKACAAAAKRAQGSEHDLIGCAFTLNTCPADKIQSLTRSLDEDRAAMASARHSIDLATSVLPQAKREEVAAAAAACPSL